MTAWLTRFSIRTRMLLLMVAGLTIILAVVGYLSAQALQKSTARVLDERLRLAQLAAMHIDDHVAKDLLGRLGRAAASEGFDLTDADLQPERRALGELYAAGLFTYDVFVTDGKGVVLLTEPDLPHVVGTDLSAHPHVREALATGERQISGLLATIATGQPVVSFVMPVVDETVAVVGLIGGAADPSSPSFAGIIAALRPVGAGHVDVVDRDGMVLASTAPAHVLKASHHRRALLPLLQERRASVGIYPVVEEGVEKGRDVVALAPLIAAPWAVSIEQPEAVALALVYALRRQMILIAAIALLVTAILTWLSIQAVLNPLGQLLAASRRIAAGDLETLVPPLGRDEVGEVGRGFEAMRQRLAAWGEELETAVRERTRDLSALYAVDRVAAQSLDLEEILGDSLDQVLEVLEIEAGGILLLEPDGETLTLRVYRGLSEAFVRAVQRIKVGEGISGRAVAEMKPAVLDVADGSTELAEVYPTERLAPFVVKEGFQSLVSTPLVSKGVALGALTLGTRRPRAFPPAEMELLVAIGQQLGGAVDNAHLFEAERRRAVQLALVADIARRAVSILDPDQLLQETANAIQQAFGYYDIILFLVDQDAGELTLKARAGSFERPFPAETPVWKFGDEGIVDWVARHGRTLVANDVSREPRYRASLPGTRSELCVSIKDGERVVAGINVESDRLYAFGEADVAALKTLADELAVALRNAQLFAERQRKITELAALNQIGRALVATLHLDELLEITYQEVTGVMAADAFFIALYDRQADELDYRIRADMGAREPQERRAPAGLTGLIVSSGEPILIRDFEREKDQYPQVKLWGSMAAPASWLGVPMVVGEQVVGVISVQAYRPEAYDDGHLALLSTIAAQAALSVENARLYEESQGRAAMLARRAQQLAALVRAGGAMVSTLELEPLLQTVVREAVAVTGVDRSTLFLCEADGTIVQAVAGHRVKGPPELPAYRRSSLADHPHLHRALQARQPILLPDLGTVELAAAERAIAEALGLTSLLFAPLLVGDRPIGALGLGTVGRVYHPSPEELDLAQTLANQVAMAVEAARTYTQARRRANQMAIVHALGRQITPLLDVDELLQTAAEALHERFGYLSVQLYLVDREAGEVETRGVAGEEGIAVRGYRQKVGEGITGQVAERGERALIDDVGREPDFIPCVPGVQSELALPIRVGAEVAGVLNIESDQLHGFDEADVVALEALAGQIGAALENARLYQATEQRLAELSALFEVTGALRRAATVEEMLPMILDKTLEVVAAEAGAIFLVNEAAQQVVVPVARGPMEEALVGRSFPLAGSVAEMMLHTGEPDISLDLAADPRMPQEMRAMLRGGESGVSLPLRAAGVPVGVMAVSWLGRHTITDDELGLLTAIADMAAGAIHRAGLHDKTVGQAQELERLVAELENTYDATLTALSAALDARDHETEGHSRRVMQLAVTIARAMGLPESEIEALMRGALLHDIGKIGVPDRILSKPGSLTDEERAQMQRHNQIGYDMLRDIEFLAPTLPVVLCHHERWDGRGYPQELRGEAIPLAARIFAVADAYDAMTSDRPYRQAMSHAEAIAEIQREAGKQFDPQVAEMFLQILRSANGQV